MFNPNHAKIGIMADSHGDPHAIEQGARLLKRHGCTTLYHLGDICDTNRYDTADACVEKVKRHAILAVKGNNDHSLAAEARGRSNSGICTGTLTFLETLPLNRLVHGAQMVHSRPDIQRLGLSAMIGTVGRREATDYFEKNPAGLLFRGHSHRPEIITTVNGDIGFAPLTPGERIDLGRQRPCVVTCGALYQGAALIWEPIDARLLICSL